MGLRKWRNALRFVGRRLAMIEELGRSPKAVVPFQIGFQRAFLVKEPELVREVLITHEDHFEKGRALKNARRLLGEGLLTSEGERHRSRRKLIQPVFHRQKVQQFAELILEETDRHMSHWRVNPGRYRVDREMNELTLSIVGRALFDTDVEADKDEVRAAMEDGRRLFDLALAPFSRYIDWIPPLQARFRRTRNRLDKIIYRMISEHRQNPRDDLLSLLIEVLDDDVQLRDEALTLFLAGHETTAISLAWTLWLISFHPRAYAELQAEVAGRPLAGEQLPFAEALVLESMRLYPPAWVIGRLCVKELQLGDVTVRPKDLLLLSPWLIHRDARFFERPLVFDPWRWLRTPRSSLPRCTYFPFGGGSRVCIGEHFAMLEAVLVLARIAQKCRLIPRFGRITELDPSITLRPAPELWVEVDFAMGHSDLLRAQEVC